MTENKIREFVQSLRNRLETFVNTGWAIDGLINDYTKSADTIEKLFKEIKQYRAIGTVEECRTTYERGYNQGAIDRAEEVTKAREHGYNKAIDEFTERLKDANTTNAFVLYQADEIDLAEFISLAVDEIAEEMRGVE